MPTEEIIVNVEKLLQTFLELVRIDSPSGKEEPVRQYLENRFKSLHILSQADEAGNLIVILPGHRSMSDLTLVITGHMDVVPPCLGVEPIVEGRGEDRLIRSAGNTVLGADDKAGLAAILEALELSLLQNLPRPNLILLFTTQEEVMLQGAKQLDPALYRDADFAIALDHTGKQGTVIYEAPTYIQFSITLHGRSAHAGIMPEKGVNAIQILSWVLEKLRFGRLDDETTSNIGLIQGGRATNIVPDRAVAQCELRGHNEARLQQELATVERVLHEVVDPIEGASFELASEICFRHYRTDPSGEMMKRVLKGIDALQLPVNLIRTNGGSDLNIFSGQGVPGVVLSAGYLEPHSLQEQVSLRDMAICTRLLLSIWEQFAKP